MEAGRSQDVAEEAAGGLLAAELQHPFGPDVEVRKIGGKIFLPSTPLRVDRHQQPHAGLAAELLVTCGGTGGCTVRSTS
ncbi:hypothetical protein REH65_28950 [Saccharopolyspora sp. ID03-671]|uniref:hypothetical protein n=1 Tax=Saccharopolyspora sp. ID03-671 TaxID=3073066 RepID=UPI00324C29FA